MINQFLGNNIFNISNQTVSATCPSNIALIKYWGKYANQIPANPSISYTLNHCNTQTSMEFFAGEPFSVQTFLAGNEEKKFAEKIEKYFKNIEVYLPWILKGKIHHQNRKYISAQFGNCKFCFWFWSDCNLSDGVGNYFFYN